MVWGAIIGAAVAAASAHAQQTTAQGATYKQMNFEERMSNTAYQRATADMREAGLNPILAAGGGGESTPSVGAAPAYDIGGAAVSTAMGALKLKEDLENIRAVTKTQGTQAKLNEALSDKTTFDALTAQSTARNIDADTILKTLAVPGATADAQRQKLIGSVQDGVLKGLDKVKQAFPWSAAPGGPASVSPAKPEDDNVPWFAR